MTKEATAGGRFVLTVLSDIWVCTDVCINASGSPFYLLLSVFTGHYFPTKQKNISHDRYLTTLLIYTHASSGAPIYPLSACRESYILPLKYILCVQLVSSDPHCLECLSAKWSIPTPMQETNSEGGRGHTLSERGAETNFKPGNLCRGTGKVQKAFKQAHAPSECAVRVLTMRWHANVASELTAARAKKKKKERNLTNSLFKKINKFEVFTVLHVLYFWYYILFACLWHDSIKAHTALHQLPHLMFFGCVGGIISFPFISDPGTLLICTASKTQLSNPANRPGVNRR